MNRLKERFHRAAAPVDAASVALFRAAFGFLLLLETIHFFQADRIARYFIQPQFFYKYYGFGWVEPWSGNGMYLHFAVMGAAAAGVMLGLCYRLSAAVLFLTYTHAVLIDQSLYNNHYYLISLLAMLLVLMPADREYAFDAWWRRRRGEAPPATVPAWSLWMLRFQIAVVYFYGGLAKLNADWLRGEPVRLWLSERADLATMPWIAAVLRSEWTVGVVAHGGMLFDLLIVPLLLWRRTRALAFAAVISFHLFNKYIFGIGIFPWLGIAATTIFFAPDWPRRWISRRAAAPEEAEEPSPGALDEPPGRALAAFLVCYVAFQLLFPFRHFLYPGDAGWTEEGHRFAWRMKLRDKTGDCLYIKVADVQTRRVESIDFRDWLMPNQSQGLMRPDMLLQFAHYLARHYREERGWTEPHVRAAIYMQMNDHPPQFLVDPWLDLAAQPRSLRHAEWIAPLQRRE